MKFAAIIVSWIFAFSILFLSSCDENSSSGNNSISANYLYFPSETGNKWVYDGYMLDMDGERTGLPSFVDVREITGKENYANREAYVFESKETGFLIEDKFYQNFTGGFLFNSTEYLSLANQQHFSTGIKLPYALQNTEYKYLAAANFNKNSWQVYTANINLFFTEIGGSQAQVSGFYYINGARGETSEITINGETHNALEFILTHKIDMIAKSQEFTAPIKFSIVTRYFYVKNIGLVKYVREPLPLFIGIPGKEPVVENIAGMELILREYEIQ